MTPSKWDDLLTALKEWTEADLAYEQALTPANREKTWAAEDRLVRAQEALRTAARTWFQLPVPDPLAPGGTPAAKPVPASASA